MCVCVVFMRVVLWISWIIKSCQTASKQSKILNQIKSSFTIMQFLFIPFPILSHSISPFGAATFVQAHFCFVFYFASFIRITLVDFYSSSWLLGFIIRIDAEINVQMKKKKNRKDFNPIHFCFNIRIELTILTMLTIIFCLLISWLFFFIFMDGVLRVLCVPCVFQIFF